MAILVASMKCVSSNDCDPLSRVSGITCDHYVVHSPVMNVLTVLRRNPLLQSCDTPEQACTEAPVRNSPRIAAFVGEETKQYFVLLEQKVLC